MSNIADCVPNVNNFLIAGFSGFPLPLVGKVIREGEFYDALAGAAAGWESLISEKNGRVLKTPVLISLMWGTKPLMGSLSRYSKSTRWGLLRNR